jgi:hypothetical protein
MAGVGLKRFYRLAADWRRQPSLGSLGVFAAAGGRATKLDPASVNALQAVVADVVSLGGGASVDELVRRMVTAAALPAESVPSRFKLRSIVEAELRRVSARHDAGAEIALDCVATTMPGSDRRPHVAFLLMDRGTRLILGAAVGDVDEARAGYAAAARDAQRRITDVGSRLPWAARLVRAEITAGNDVDACVMLVGEINAALGSARVQLATAERRFGAYARRIVGDSLGRISFTPARTGAGEARPPNGDMAPWTDAEAATALRLAVDAHNSEMTGSFDGVGGLTPSGELVSFLGIVAD